MLSFLKGFAAFGQPQYWLNPNPVPLGPSLVGGIMAFFAWFIVAAVALAIFGRWLKKHDRLKRSVVLRFASLLFWTGFLGLVFLFFSYEQIPCFGARGWFLLVTILFLVWLIRAVLYAVRDYPKEKVALAIKEQQEKYLPKKK